MPLVDGPPPNARLLVDSVIIVVVVGANQFVIQVGWLLILDVSNKLE